MKQFRTSVTAQVTLSSQTPHFANLFVEVSHEDPERELSPLAQVCT